MLVGSLLGLRNLLRQFPSPGVLRSPHHFGNGTGPGVLGLLHRVRALCPSLQPSARLQPGHGAILRITSGRPTFGFCFTTISGRQMCAPCTRTNTRFCRIAPFVQNCRFYRVRFSCCCQADPSIFARFLIVVKSKTALPLALTSHCSHPAERFTYSGHTLIYLTRLEYCVLSWLTLKLGFIYFLAHIRRFVMASSSPTTSIPIQEPVFLQFLHDVHHAYLLLHRAMALLPPTLILNIEPTPLPSTDVYGINLMGYDHITRTRPTTSLTMPTSRRRISWRTRHLWMNWWKPISLNHTTTLPLRHLKSYLHPRSFLPEHHHRRLANRKPNQLPKRLPNVVADLTNPDPAPRAHCHSGLPKTNRNYAL